LFDKFPYLLPNLVCAGFVVIGLVIGLLFLEETHEDKKDRRDHGLEFGRWILEILRFKTSHALSNREESAMFIPEDEKTFDFGSTDSSPRLSTVSTSVPEVEVYVSKSSLSSPRKAYTWGEMFNNQVLLLILGLGLLALYVSNLLHKFCYSILKPISSHTIAFEQLLPVLFSMPESRTTPELPFKFVGGFALSTKTIGTILSIQGFLQMIAQVFVFPNIVKRLGALKTFRLAIFGYPILYFLVPYLSLVPRLLRYPAILFVLLWKVTAQTLSYPSTSLMLADAAPPKVLGTLNGFAQSSACLARTIGPVLAGTIQAAGLRIGYSGLSWWFCASIAVFGAIASCWQHDQTPSTSSVTNPSIVDIAEEEALLGEPVISPEPRNSSSTLIESLVDFDEDSHSSNNRPLSKL
jgi:hypothetical protein